MWKGGRDGAYADGDGVVERIVVPHVVIFEVLGGFAPVVRG